MIPDNAMIERTLVWSALAASGVIWGWALLVLVVWLVNGR